MDLSQWAPSIERFADWINARDFDAAKHWANRLKDGSPDDHVEGAVAEAVAWDWLSCRCEQVDVRKPGASRAADFLCSTGNQYVAVEVTNVSRATMTRVTGMQDRELFSGFVGSPSRTLHSEIVAKAGQGRDEAVPYVVFVTTLHGNASRLVTDRRHIESVLHSESYISGAFDPARGEVVGPLRNTVDFQRAAFTRTRSIAPMRRHISGALFGPFAGYPDQIEVLGILNPDAVRPLDSAVFVDVPFCRFRAWPPPRGGDLVEWIEPAARQRADAANSM